MTGDGPARMPARRGGRWAVYVLLAVGFAILVGANAHLVYVAFASHPDCVPHFKEAGRNGDAFRAASSAC